MNQRKTTTSDLTTKSIGIDTRIVAIDPGTKHMGFAAFEGNILVDYGVKTIRQGSEEVILGHLEEIISRLIIEKRPDYLVLERNSFSQITQNFRLMLAISRMKHIARKHGVLVHEYSPRTVRKVICNDGNASKIRVAQTTVTLIEELRVFLQTDKAWVLRYNLNLLDAVAIGVTFILKHFSAYRTDKSRLSVL